MILALIFRKRYQALRQRIDRIPHKARRWFMKGLLFLVPVLLIGLIGGLLSYWLRDYWF